MFNRLLLLLVFLLIPQFAAAQSADLTQYVPGTSKVLIGANFSELRTSPVYSEVFAFARAQPRLAEIMNFMQAELNVSPEKDIQGLVLAFPEAMTTPQVNSTLSLAMRAPLDSEKVIESARKRFPDMKVTGEKEAAVYDVGAFKFALPAKDVFVLGVGSEPFVEATFATIKGPKLSASKNSDVVASMNSIDTKKGLWMVGITREVPQQGPKMNRAGLTIDLKSGLIFKMVADMANKKDAEQAVKDFEGLKVQASNPMVAMTGAAPLVSNLKASSKKTSVTVNSSMNSKEFALMVTQMKNIIAQGSQPMAPAPSPSKPAPSNDGVEADFN